MQYVNRTDANTDIEGAVYYTLDLGDDLSMVHIHPDWDGNTGNGNDMSFVITLSLCFLIWCFRKKTIH